MTDNLFTNAYNTVTTKTLNAAAFLEDVEEATRLNELENA
jgi:hypothetical protein